MRGLALLLQIQLKLQLLLHGWRDGLSDAAVVCFVDRFSLVLQTPDAALQHASLSGSDAFLIDHQFVFGRGLVLLKFISQAIIFD